MIEDLTHEDYIKIADILPKQLTMKDIMSYSEKVSLLFLLPEIDATGSIFIAMSINNNVTVREYEETKTRRVAEVQKLRNKENEI